MRSFVIVSTLFILPIQFAASENILFYFGVTGFSHVSSIWPLAQALADKGHNVTVFTPFPTKQKAKPEAHIHEIVSDELLQLFSSKWDADADLIRERMNGNQDSFWDLLPSTGVQACEIVLTSQRTAAMVYDSKFDLVIVDIAFNECGIALAHYKYHAPYIVWSATSFNSYVYDQYGFPLETSAITDLESTYVGPLTFYEKVRSVLIALKWTFIRQYYFFDPLADLVQEKLELPERPSFTQLNSETSLFLMNTYHTTHHARSAPPLLVQVGGMHITEERHPLPSELVNFLTKRNSDYQGFMYVSFGTLVRFAKSDEKIRSNFFHAFGNATQMKFIWKWDGPIPNKIPSNVYLSTDWLPQQDIYAHPDIRGVISHGGINGMHEAVYFGVPLIVFAIAADQDFNGNTVASKGYGIKLEITTFTQMDLEDTMTEILTSPSFKTNAELASKLFKDRPMSPVQTALWWTEYVLRHKNTSSLMSVTRHQSWYEKRLLDVWIALFVALQLSMAAVVISCCKVSKLFRLSTTTTETVNTDGQNHERKNMVKKNM